MLLLGALLACSLTNDSDSDVLAVRLGNHLNTAIAAETQTRDLWDRLLFGETVSCSETIATVPLFELSSKDAQQYPETVEIRDHLNAALLAIHHATQLWDQECQQSRPIVPLAVVHEAENTLLTAQMELELASEAWHVWQP